MNNSPSILIADDDGITRHLLRLLLRENEFSVVGEAHDGERALELCNKLGPDILCLDINMPKMGGLDVLREIRRRQLDVTVIMITVLATVDNLQEALALGANGFIVKPFNAAKVVDTINRCFSKVD